MYENVKKMDIKNLIILALFRFLPRVLFKISDEHSNFRLSLSGSRAHDRLAMENSMPFQRAV